MGQAFDRAGNVLGDAYGETKREVFDKLNERFKDAAEIRIRTLAEMPRYQSHKKVWALKIKEIKQAPPDQERQHAGGDWYLVPVEAGFAPIVVGHAYILKHTPRDGGYYVRYEDGYESFSPAEAFESGYTRI